MALNPNDSPWAPLSETSPTCNPTTRDGFAHRFGIGVCIVMRNSTLFTRLGARNRLGRGCNGRIHFFR
ncbi:hypothetical protein AVEN_154397-1, partial [Araneus ventricosus]